MKSVKGKRGEQKRIRPASPSPSKTAAPSGIITLLTDFGTTDYFVGAMKGVILSANREAVILDISHDIPPQDIHAGAFTLLGAYKSFPAGTIHVAVVDPGVGSERLPLVVSAGQQFFVGPDNGIFSYVLEHEPDHQVVAITNDKFFREEVSSTFHGRDIFAPVAAALSSGVAPGKFGEEIDDYVRLEPLAPEKLASGQLRGRVIHIDRFGNCITNFTRASIGTELKDGRATLAVNGKRIRTLKRFFAEDSGNQDQLFAIWGSAGFLEIAAQNRSAAKILKAKRGQGVVLRR